MAVIPPIEKFSISNWRKYPTTIILIVAVNVVWILIFMVTDMAKSKSKECMEQVVYLRNRLDKVETQIDEYTTAILFKDGQIKSRDNIIDSLKKGTIE